MVPEGSPHRFVVHAWLVLLQPPETRHSLRVHQLEDALLAVRPLDVTRTVFFVLQHQQQELPQVLGAIVPSAATARTHLS